MLFGKELIGMVYGVEYIEAYAPFVVHMDTVLLSGVFFWSLSFVLSIGRVHFRLVMNVVGLIVASVMVYVLVPKVGAVGVALALLVARGIPVVAFAFVARTYFKVRKEEG